MMLSERSASIHRIPIITPKDNSMYQTIVASNKDYTNATVMNTYPTIEAARMGYSRDMDGWALEHGHGYHFAIRKHTPKEDEGGEEKND